MSIDGIFIINKAAGITSYGVVARVKRFSGEKRAGHAGTLDPAAAGVLPVCLGKATRTRRTVAYQIDQDCTVAGQDDPVTRGEPEQAGVT